MSLLLLLAALSARADDIFEAPGLVEILPAGEITGDGATRTTIHAIALRPDGSPYTGLLLQPGARAGETDAWTEVGGGVYSFSYLPPRTQRPLMVDLFVKGRTEDKLRLRPTYTVPVSPPMATALSVSSSPTEVVLGRESEVSLTITVDAITGPQAPEDLEVHVTAGQVENLVYMGLGEFRARWTVPEDAGRQLAILTVADRRQPTRSYGVLGLPLSQELEVDLEDLAEGASILLKIGDKEFGPVQADAKGRATVPVTVSPGPGIATQVAVVDGDIQESEVDLELPEVSRVRILPMLPTIPADEAVTVPVRVVVFNPEGARDPGADLAVTASTGEVGEPRHEGDGVYLVDYAPATANEAGEVEFSAVLDGSEVHIDSHLTATVPARPAAVTLDPTPAPLPLGAEALEVVATVTGAAGTGLAGRAVDIDPTGGKTEGDLEDREDGTYAQRVVPLGEGPIELLGTARSVATDNPLRGLVIVPLHERVPHDGISTNMLTVVGLDEFGYPVAGVEVALRVEDGGGDLPATVTTDEHGAGTVFYTSGRSAGLVRLRANARGFSAATAFYQGPAPLEGAPALPVSGSAEQAELAAAWRGLAAHVRVERE